MAQQRGRKTAGALEAVVSTQRPEPATHLTDEQKEIWTRVVNALPPEWFRAETLDLLSRYCAQVTAARQLDQRIEALPADAPLADLKLLMALQDKASRVIMSLATKMRLSQQSTYDKVKRKDSPDKPVDPWPSAA